MSQVLKITEAEWEEWKLHPVTKRFRQFLKGQLEELQQQWVEGNFTSDTSDATAQINARSIGKAQNLVDIIELSSEILNEENA